MDAYQISVAVAFALAIAEVMTMSFILLGFSLGMLAVAGVQYLFTGFNLNRDLMVFAGVSAASFLSFRVLFKRKSDVTPLSGDDINQY